MRFDVWTSTACAALFAAGAMGGGDVKLLTALALWLPPARFAQLLVVMALTGGVLALLCVMGPTMKRRSRQQPASAVPYGVAIAGGALWVLARDYLPVAAAGLPATVFGS